MERWVQFGLGVVAGITAFAAGSHLYTLWRQKKRVGHHRSCYRSPLGLWNSEDPEVDLESTRGSPPTQSNTEGTENHDHGLLNCLYAIAEDQARRHGVHHRGVCCNNCQASPISGVRYKCANCIDYDVCEKCLGACGHDETHTFLRIPIPVCPLTNPRSPVLCRSLYQGQAQSYSRVLAWEEITHLQSITHFAQSEIESLFQQFRCLTAGQGGIHRLVFNECLGPLGLEHNLIVERLFAFYDQDNNGWIDFHEFCCGLSILTKGNRDEKITPAFNGFDLENCGYIRRQDFRRMFKAYFFVTVELVRDVVRACEDEMLEGFEDDPSKPVSAIFNAPIPTRPHSSGDMSPGNKPPLPPGTPGLIARRQESGIWPVLEVVSQDAVEELVEMVMSGADTNSDGRVSFEEFANYVLVDPTVLAWLDALGPVF